MNKTKPEKWIRFRHKIIRWLIKIPFALTAYFKYGFIPTPVKDSKKRQYIIVMNHATPFDQFFVGLSINRPVYYVATEDIFSLGFLSRLLEWAVAPIPIKKSTQDMNAIRNIMQVAKEGGTICIFPEGNRTYSGCTEYIKPAITKLIKMTGLPVVCLKLEGGYGVEPRWSTKKRKGKVTCRIAKILEPEDYKKMSADDFYKDITDTIFTDDAASGLSYECEKRSKYMAEYMERIVYICPNCGLTHFKSEGNIIRCLKCNLEAEYTPDLKFKSISGLFPYTTLKEWYNAQEKFISNLDLSKYYEEAAFTESVSLYKVRLYKSKIQISEHCDFTLYGNRFVINNQELLFDDIKAVSVLGRNKLNIYYKDEVFQVKSDERFNAVKYLHFYHHYKNTTTSGEAEIKGGGNEFLGL